MDEKELERLYNAVNSKFDVGDYNTFKSKMGTSDDRKKFYDAVGSKGFDLGDYNQFETRIGGKQEPIPHDPAIFPTPKTTKEVQADYEVSGKIPSVKDFQNSIPKYAQGNQPSSTSAPLSVKTSAEDFINRNAELAEKNKKTLDEAFTNTAKKIVAAKGKPVDDTKPLGVFEYAKLLEEKKKLEEAHASGDNTLAFDKDGKPGLKRTTGAWETFSNKFNEALDGNDKAQAFYNASPEERVAMLSEKEVKNKHPEYLGESPSPAGSVTGFVGENAPVLARGAAGAVVGSMLAAAAPETGGLSMAGAPSALAFLFTANDAKNNAVQATVTERYYSLLKDNPNMPPVEAMKEASKGELMGGITGILENALLTGTSIKLPLAPEGQQVVKNAIKKTLAASVHLGAATAGVEGLRMAEGNLEGYHTSPTEAADKMAETFAKSATVGALLHAITSVPQLPKVLKSAFKYALKDVPTPEIKATLQMNEQAGTIPAGTTNKVINEIQEYKEASAKTLDGLSPDVHASVAGLIEAKNKLVEESKTKDNSFKPFYADKIAGIDHQIQQITESGRPYNHEVDEMSGNKYRKQPDAEVPEVKEVAPAESSPKENLPEEQGKEVNLPMQWKVGDVIDTEQGKATVTSITDSGSARVTFEKGNKGLLPKGYEKPSTEVQVKPTVEVSTVGDAIKKHDEVENYTFDDMVNDIENISDNKKISGAVEEYRKAQEEDRKLSGRGDMDKAQDNFLNAIKEAKPSKEVSIPIEEKSKKGGFEFGNKTFDELEKKQSDLEDEMAANKDWQKNEPLEKEHSAIDKELEKRERDSVFSVPLEQVKHVIDGLIKKEKERPGVGYGTYIEMRDARETKSVAEKYLNPKEITDDELKQDFKDAVLGNPSTWYADGMKLRESMKEASNRGIDIKEMIAKIENQYIKDGYSAKDAHETVARKLKPIFEGSQKVETSESKLLSENKPINETTLTPEESKVSEKIPDDLANHIAEGKDITVETLEKHKDEIVNDKDAPYTKEDYETVKNYLDETGRHTEEPAADEQQGTGNAEAKTTPIQSEETQAGTATSPEGHTDGEVGGQGLGEREQKVIIEKMGSPIGEWLKRAFTSNRGLPEMWMVLKDLATGRRQLAARNMRKAIYNLQDAVKQTKYTDTDKISEALKDTNGTAFQSLPPEIQTAVKDMRLMVDGFSEGLVTEGLVTPGQALTISDHIGEYLNRSYKLHTQKDWIKKVDPAVKADAIKFLTQQRLSEINADPNHATKTAAERMDLAQKLGEQDANDILTKKDTPTGQRYTEQFSKDLSTLKTRQDIPEPIRKLMGEYTDPVTQFAITISKLATLHSQAKLLNSLRDTFKGQLFFEKDEVRPEGFNYQVASDGSQAWNPLAGLYTSESAIKALQENAQHMEAWHILYQKAFGTVKKFKTVYSVPTQVVNFFANPFISLANGHFNLGKLNKSWDYYKDTMFNKERGSDDVINTLVERNVIGQSVNLRQIRDMLGKDKADEFALSEFMKPKRSNWNPLKWIDKADKVMQNQYSASDSFWKVYGFMNEASGLSDALFGKKYKDLTGADKIKIDELASERIKNTYPTYDRALPALMAAGKNIPFVGNFMAFQAEVLRTVKNNILYAKQDLKDPNPKIKQMGAKRLAGLISYVGLKQGINLAAVMATGTAASSLWAAATGNDDEKNKRQSLDKFAPDFLQTHNLMVESKANGVYSVYDIDRLDPYNAAWQSLNGFAVGKDGGVAKAIEELAGPFVEPDMLLRAAMDINKNENFSGKPIYNTADTKERQFMDKMAYVYGVIEPTTAKLFNRARKADSPTKEVVASLFGARSYDIDVKLSFKSKVHEAEEKLSANSYFNYKDKEGTEKQELKDNFKRAVMELNDYYNSAVKLGASPAELNELLGKSFSRISGASRIKQIIKTGNVKDSDIDTIYKKKK